MVVFIRSTPAMEIIMYIINQSGLDSLHAQYLAATGVDTQEFTAEIAALENDADIGNTIETEISAHKTLCGTTGFLSLEPENFDKVNA